MSKVAKIFGGGTPKVDTSAIDAQKKQIADQEAKIAKQEEEQRAKDAAKLRSRLGRSSGGAGGNTLLTGLETGLRDTLG